MHIGIYPGTVAASKVPATSLIIYCDVERYASVSEDKISFSLYSKLSLALASAALLRSDDARVLRRTTNCFAGMSFGFRDMNSDLTVPGRLSPSPNASSANCPLGLSTMEYALEPFLVAVEGCGYRSNKVTS